LATYHAKLFWRLLFWQSKTTQFKHTCNFKSPVNSNQLFTPFNFADLFRWRNSRNKGHANIKGFTVTFITKQRYTSRQYIPWHSIYREKYELAPSEMTTALSTKALSSEKYYSAAVLR